MFIDSSIVFCNKVNDAYVSQSASYFSRRAPYFFSTVCLSRPLVIRHLVTINISTTGTTALRDRRISWVSSLIFLWPNTDILLI